MLKYLFLFNFLLAFLYNSAQDSLNVKLLYQWQDSTLPASSAYFNTYNEIWGLFRNGREYAVIGSTMGTHFFDISDIQNVVEVDFIPGAFQGNQVVHRDYHDYQNYLYMVCDEGPSTLQIVDLSYLPDSVHLVYDSNNLFKRSHNIFIDTAKAMLYVCSESTNSGFNAMSLYKLDDPLKPQRFYSWQGVGHVHDVYVSNDTAFCNAGLQGLYIMNFSDSLNPVTLGTLTSYPEQGYNHSGWLSDDRQTYVFADETWGQGIKICDASDLSDLQIESIINSNVDSNSIAHNLILKDNILYISYYHDGLYMFDITNRSNPQLIGYYDTYLNPDHLSYRGAWGVYPFLPSGNILISDMQSGLFVFDVTSALAIETPETDNNQLNIYPNPASNKLTLSFNVKEAGEGEYLMVDISGRVIFQEIKYFSTGTYIDKIDLPRNMLAGTYFLKIILPGAQLQHQIIKIN